MNTNLAHKYEDIYEGIKQASGDNPGLLQSFVYNNNTDIIKTIEYYKLARNNASEEEKVNYTNIIARLENIMLQRLSITEDLFATSLPLMQHGPHKVEVEEMEQKGETSDVNKKKKDPKVIDHPASKKQEKTVNDDLGEQIAKKREKTEEERKETEEKNKREANEKVTPDYLKRYPTKEQQLEAINTHLLPVMEKYLFGENKSEDNARKTARIHFMSYGKNIRAYSDTDIEHLIQWLKSGYFQGRSPIDILTNKRLTIQEIVQEINSLIVSGMDRRQVRNFLAPYVLNTNIEGRDEVISSERKYIEFFRSSLEHLFKDENVAALRITEEKKKRSREDIKKSIYEKHKDSKKPVFEMSKELRNSVSYKAKEGLKTARIEMLVYLKANDRELYDQYHAKSNKSKDSSTKKTVEKKKEEKSNLDIKKVTFGKIEDVLKHKDTLTALKEYLITLANKKISPVGDRKDGMDKIVEDLTLLAKKRILVLGLREDKDGKNYDDWTESDISEFMSAEVLPYITEKYGILKSENADELKENLKFYLDTYPAGEEKGRTKALKEVADSEVPRSNYMKKITRAIRKDKLNEINDMLKEINEQDKENVKKTK